jgi:hypothetical protein
MIRLPGREYLAGPDRAQRDFEAARRSGRQQQDLCQAARGAGAPTTCWRSAQAGFTTRGRPELRTLPSVSRRWLLGGHTIATAGANRPAAIRDQGDSVWAILTKYQ